MLSVVLVASFLFAFLGLTNVIITNVENQTAIPLLIFTVFVLALLLFISALLFFIDSLFFSAFKKSRWFSIIFYPIYRVFSIISLSFIYRSIYYHLITNFRKKHIIMVSGILLVLVVISNQLNSWNRYTFYPDLKTENRYVLSSVHYDDERTNGYIYTASIPSKVVSESYLPLFIRYSPEHNFALQTFCPEFENLNDDLSLREGIEAGVKSQQDTTKTVSELISEKRSSAEDMRSALSCINSTYEIKLDSTVIPADLMYTAHKNKGEKGFLQMLDIGSLERGKHTVVVKRLEYQGTMMDSDIKKERFKMIELVEIVFWKE